MGREKTKQLTESALLMAVSIVLFFGAFLPLLGILVAPFSPLPLCILTVRYGLKHALLVALVTLGLLILLFSIVLGGAFIPFLFVGLLLGALVRHGATGLRALVLGTLATALLLMGLFCFYDYMAEGSEHLLTSDQFLERSFENMQELVAGLEDTVLKGNEEMLASLSGGVATLQRLVDEVFRFPLAFFTSLAAMGFSLSYLVASLMSKKLELSIPALPRFSRWQGLKSTSLLFLLTYLLTMYFWRDEALRNWRIYALNFLFLFLLYHIVLGLSLLESFLAERKIDPILRFVLHLVALRFLTLPPAPVLTTAALLDPFFDFRGISSGQSAGDGAKDTEVLEKGDMGNGSNTD